MPQGLFSRSRGTALTFKWIASDRPWALQTGGGNTVLPRAVARPRLSGGAVHGACSMLALLGECVLEPAPPEAAVPSQHRPSEFCAPGVSLQLCRVPSRELVVLPPPSSSGFRPPGSGYSSSHDPGAFSRPAEPDLCLRRISDAGAETRGPAHSPWRCSGSSALWPGFKNEDLYDPKCHDL